MKFYKDFCIEILDSHTARSLLDISKKVYKYNIIVGYKDNTKPKIMFDFTGSIYDYEKNNRFIICVMGYNPDSIKYFEVYRACQESTTKMRQLGITNDCLYEMLNDENLFN